MTRPDDWARVDYRSRAAAAICVIVTTLVTAVTLTAYVGTRIGFAEGVLVPTPPREAAFVAQQCPPRYVHQVFGLKGTIDEMPTPWRRAQKSWINRHVVAPYGVGGSDDSLLRVSSILDYLC